MYNAHNRAFKTKAEARKAMSNLMHSLPLNTYLEGDDLAFIYDAIMTHPKAKKKFSAGVKAIQVVAHTYQRRFDVVLADGARIDFSISNCFDAPAPTKLDYFRTACRVAVRDQTEAYKDAHLGEPCPITKIITNRNNSAVDHCPPLEFDRIVYNYLESTGIDINAVSITGTTTKVFTNSADAAAFSDYHASVAVLRLIEKKENLKLPKVKNNWSKYKS